jgi:hypothetical protein
MLFTETVAVYRENHTKHINILSGRNAELFHVKAAGQPRNWCLTPGRDKRVFSPP